MNAKRGEKETHGSGVILPAIVSLESKYGEVELGMNISDESSYGVKNVRLVSKRDGPKVMSIVIKKNDIVLITRMAKNRRRPNIRVNKLKRKI